MNDILVYGVSGFGREVAFLIEQCIDSGKNFKILGFIDDDINKQDTFVNNYRVLSLENAIRLYPNAFVAIGVGNPQIKKTIAKKVYSAGFRFTNIIHPRTEISSSVTIGEGAIICAGSVLTVNIQIGSHVHINLDCTVGHDVVLGNNTTLAPGVHVSGCVHIGKGVLIGTGATIINGDQDNPVIIGDDAVIGAGACVTRSVNPGTTVVGIPAKPMGKNHFSK